MLTALLNSYPAPRTVKAIASEANISDKTAYLRGHVPTLVKDGFIRVDEREEKGGGRQYIIENVNSLSRINRIKYKNYSLAPGNVEYSDEFKNAWNALVNQQEIESHCISLLGFVKCLVRK